ncbi:hypothetical protein Tco_0691753 [Tanacetum coccineum]
MNKSVLASYSSSIVNIKSIIPTKRLNELAYGIPLDGPYQTNPPSIEDIILSIRIDREDQVRRIHHEEEIDVLEYQILTHEIVFNLAYYMAKRIEWVTKQGRLILPYGMLLTRLFKFIMNEYLELYNESYVLYDRLMNPLAAQLERKLRRDHGTRRGRPSTSSSTFDKPSLSHLNYDDDSKGSHVQALLPPFVMSIP